mgnify:CR=1 FL=1
MWVAYFLPRWVHDRNEFSGKNVERYKSALRIVAENSPGGSSGTGVIHTDLDREAKIAQQLMRRRIIFSIIIIAFVMTTVGAIMQTLAISFIGIPVVGFVLYLAHVRHQTTTDRARRRRVARKNRPPGPRRANSAAPKVVSSVIGMPASRAAMNAIGSSLSKRGVWSRNS